MRYWIALSHMAPLLLLMQVAASPGCPCINSQYLCYNSDNGKCYSSLSNGGCSTGLNECELTPCQAGCAQCHSSGAPCFRCDEGLANTMGKCMAPKEAYAGVRLQRVGKLVLLASNAINNAVRAGFEQAKDRSEACEWAIAATLHLLGDVADIAYIVPGTFISNDAQMVYSSYYSWSDVGIDRPRLQGYVAQRLLPRGTQGPLLHELGHMHNVFLGNLLPNNRFYSHWGFSALDKAGMLGGYPRDSWKCTDPPNLIPGPSATCNANPDGTVVISYDSSKPGSPSASNDATGKFAKLELFMMGLVPFSDVEDEYVSYCEAAEYDSTASTFTCDNLHIVTAAQIAAEVQPIRAPMPAMQGGGVTAAMIVVLPGDAQLPDAVDELSDDLQALNEYAANLPSVFSSASGGVGKITFDLDAPSSAEGPPSKISAAPSFRLHSKTGSLFVGLLCLSWVAGCGGL